MTSEKNLEEFYTVAVMEALYTSKGNLRFFLGDLFKDISFTNKVMLEIGSGSGLLSFYAACRGAKKVVCLEPEADGSNRGVIEEYKRIENRLRLSQVRLEATTFQAYNPEGNNFDIVLLHNSINHLNEWACINLHNDPRAKEIYRDIFQKLGSISNPGATLLTCDCSRYNFFSLMKLKNPIDPSIQWNKHQAPKVWIDLLAEVGFVHPKVTWSSFNTLRSVGQFFLGNPVASFFLTSHYCLRMLKEVE